jgi:hypothetical protein
MAEKRKKDGLNPTGSSDRRGRSAQEGGEFRSSAEVRTALIQGNTFGAKAVQYSLIDGMGMFEGDIVLGTEEQIEERTRQLQAEMSGQLARGVVITGSQFRWPNCRIPYTIDPALPNQARVTDAIAHWQDRTRFRFVVRTNETDYVTFRPSGGCSSSVGRQGGQQFVNLGTNCTTGNCIHEIGHVVGLWHEQSREDRDAFVAIHWDKIQAGMEHNFNQHVTDGDDVGAYDYGSIMHYPRNAFSVDGSDTITPTTPGATIGQRTALSSGDIATANSFCPKPTKETVKDIRKDVIHDTIKERIKDAVLDTRKETVLDTRKETVLDTRKEVPSDLGPGTWAEQVITPGQPSVTPVSPVLQPGLNQPFTVVTPHHAPAAGATETGVEASLVELDGQLQVLADQLAQTDAQRQVLQAQYDETAALLRQAVQAHDQASGKTGG